MPLSKKQQELDKTLNVLQWTPEAIAARELAIKKAAVGARSTRAATARTAIKKVAVPAELALNAVEAARLASSPELREARVGEAEDLAKKGIARRLLAAIDNPVGTIYGAAALAKETYDTLTDPRLREQDAAYFDWMAKRKIAAAEKAGAQQKGRAAMIRGAARSADKKGAMLDAYRAAWGK